jgi:NAD(P)-dependent dehydrogenase (short-subunit alcohol dehydrogenase family)
VITLLDQVMGDFGRLDGLVNCAGVQPRAALLEMDEWELRRTIEVNLIGPYFTMQRVGRILREAGGGVMVNIAADLEQPGGWPMQTAFIASKHGLLALGRQAADELRPDHIHVHTLCPARLEAGDLPGLAASVVALLQGGQA